MIPLKEITLNVFDLPQQRGFQTGFDDGAFG
jgi:hypothetical protein